MTFEGTRAIGAALGSAVVMPFDDSVDLSKVLLRIAAFSVTSPAANVSMPGRHGETGGSLVPPVRRENSGRRTGAVAVGRNRSGHERRVHLRTRTHRLQRHPVRVARWAEFSDLRQGLNPKD